MADLKESDLVSDEGQKKSGIFIPEHLFKSDEQIFSPEILRSNLFNARNSGVRKYYDNQQISAIGECTIRYTGEELRVIDLEVIKYVLSQLKGRTLRIAENEIFVRFTRFEACQTIFNGTGGSDYRKLNESLERMARKSSLTFSYEKKDGSYIKLDGVSLIRKYIDVQDEFSPKGLIEAYLEPEIVRLLGFEHSILPLNTEKLSPQAIKIRDYLITRPDPREKINLVQLKNVIWGSEANFKSLRNQLSRVSKSLVEHGYLRSNIRVNKYKELEFDIGERIDANRNSDPNQFLLELDF